MKHLDIVSPISKSWRVIRLMRAPALGAILSLLLLSLPSQTKEIYLIYLHDRFSNPTVTTQIIFGYLSLFVLCFVIWFLATHIVHRNDKSSYAVDTNPTSYTFATFYATFIALLPLLGVTIGLLSIQHDPKSNDLREVADVVGSLRDHPVFGSELYIFSTDLLSLPTTRFAVVTAIVTCLIFAIVLAGFSAYAHLRNILIGDRAYRILLLVGLATTVSACLVFALQNQETDITFPIGFMSISQTLGAPFIINLFLVCGTIIVSYLISLYDKHGIPVVSALILIAIVASACNWNDNHHIRTFNMLAVPGSKSTEHERFRLPSVKDAFEEWLAARPEAYKQRFEDQGQPYPIFVFAAQGGGMYAAHQAGLTLARLYDRCPALQHHVFAVSGVSGGSVGAGIFTASLQDAWSEGSKAIAMSSSDQCNFEAPDNEPGPVEQRLWTWLRTDHLSPVLGGLLFPDFLQRFVPYPPLTSLDRARALELSFETAFARAASDGRNPLREPFRNHWKADGFVPMLFLNTTHVESGRQVAIAPAATPEVRNLYRYYLEDWRDMPLSAAMVLSARFPVITPAGTIKKSSIWGRNRFVDGGYYENSGIHTALDIVSSLRQSLVRLNSKSTDRVSAQINLVALSNWPSQRGNALSNEGLSEVLSPVRALFRTREIRGQMYEREARLLFSKRREKQTQPHLGIYRSLLLYPEYFNLSLSWQVSEQLSRHIRAHIGEPAHCSNNDKIFNLEDEMIARCEKLVTDREERQLFRTAFNCVFINTLIHVLQRNSCGIRDILSMVRGEAGQVGSSN